MSKCDQISRNGRFGHIYCRNPYGKFHFPCSELLYETLDTLIEALTAFTVSQP